MKIAVINTGSSSLKFKLFDMKEQKVLTTIFIEHIGESGAKYANHKEALESIEIDFKGLDAIGHRVVHGGDKLTKATLITEDVIETIRDLIPLAPLHNPANLEGIILSQNKAENVPNIAVFDTAFHATLAPEAYLYALPIELSQKHHIRRYGFHGTSHAYLLKQAALILQKDLNETSLITLHLGNGASVCAIKNGQSIDTSMGFTPLEGLVMGTRSGDIDPAIIFYMEKELGYTTDEIEMILNKKSGLFGLTGSNDVREIVENDDAKSRLALEIMIRRLQKYIASYMVLLDEVDAIVFSGGIGENSAYIRERVMSPKMFKNIKSFVIKTDEELEIASECLKFLKE